MHGATAYGWPQSESGARHTSAYAPAMRADDPLQRAVARGDRAAVGPDRLRGVRRAARARRAVSRAVRGAAGVADRRAVRAGARRHEPAAGPRLDAACDLLRLAAARGAGAVLGGLCFVLPGLVLILALSALFLSGSPPGGCAARAWGAGAAVAAVAVRAGLGVAAPIWRRAAGRQRARVFAYALAGGLAAALAGPWLVLVLLGCGAIELSRPAAPRRDRRACSPRRFPSPGAMRRRAARAIGHRACPGRAHRERRPRRHRRAGLDGPEGRGAGVRRRLRDRPADAVGRRRHLPLDDPRAVSERGRPRPGHARAGHPHGGGRRLLGGGAPGRAAGPP